MALVSLRQLLDYAAEHDFAVPAFNISNMEQVQAIMQAADACDSPVIMQGSAGANRYAGAYSGGYASRSWTDARYLRTGDSSRL